MNRLVFAAAAFALALSAGAASAQGMPGGVTVQSGTLTTSGGLALYTFDKDAPGVSNCNDQCAVHWPPLMADAAAQPMGDWTVVTRADNSHQWAYKGAPLYTWIRDAAGQPGTGGSIPAWHLAQP